jgi:hypothetical protein
MATHSVYAGRVSSVYGEVQKREQILFFGKQQSPCEFSVASSPKRGELSHREKPLLSLDSSGGFGRATLCDEPNY